MVINTAAWSTTPADDTRLNRMTNVANIGTVLAGLDKTKHGLFICTSDGSGLVKDHVYLCNAAGDSLIDISTIASHTHFDSNDGGEFSAILAANNNVVDLLLTKTQDLDKANWIQTVTGTGSIENKTDGTTGERSIRLRPNGTSGSGATISYPHLKLDFSRPSGFTAKLQIETATSIALHTGVNCDDVTAADSNTVKYQAEVCTVTNNNWWLRTASGSANSASDTGIAITANRMNLAIQHRPEIGTPEVNISIDGAAAFQKTSNIPTSSTTASNNIVKHSVKNSTGADRPLLMYGCRISYSVKDNWPQFV